VRALHSWREQRPLRAPHAAAAGVGTLRHPVTGSHESSVHASPSSQFGGSAVATHNPVRASHARSPEQASLDRAAQAAASAVATRAHPPVVELQ
jgi:hypothetical protein